MSTRRRQERQAFIVFMFIVSSIIFGLVIL